MTRIIMFEFNFNAGARVKRKFILYFNILTIGTL